MTDNGCGFLLYWDLKICSPVSEQKASIAENRLLNEAN